MPSSSDSHERFMRLLLEHEPAILRSVLVFVPNRADARDILQETAVALWQHFDEYEPARPFDNWAVGFARIQVRRFFRNIQRQAKLSERAVEALLTADDESAGERELRDAALRQCLALLPANQREVITGYYFDECSVDALAAGHKRSTEAIYKTLQRIRLALAGCIQQRLQEVQA